MATKRKAAAEESPPFDAAELREVCWQIGTQFPFAFHGDHIAIIPVHPRQAYIRWHVREASVGELREKLDGSLDGARLIVRVYDVTDVIFDGFNAHGFFDIDVDRLFGNHYLEVHRHDRDLMVELGFRRPDGAFHALARSQSMRCDRDRPAGEFRLDGLYVGGNYARVFPVENIMDAPVYERLHSELEALALAPGPLDLALLYTRLDPLCEQGGQLPQLIDTLCDRLRRLDIDLERIDQPGEQPEAVDESFSLATRAERQATQLFDRLAARQRKHPFSLLHAHDWSTIPAALKAREALGLPFVLSLHSTEHERHRGGDLSGDAAAICAWEQRGVEVAELVVVPHSSTRQQVISLYGADPERVTIVTDIFAQHEPSLPDPADAKRQLQLNPDWPLVLYASEISHAAGADLLMDAVINVCREHGTVHFLFAGEGPLRGELEGRAWHAGVGHRCRFLGDVPGHYFETVLLASDFVVIPARTWQDEGLAQMAIAYGKPALITHQSHIGCVTHGENGLITYDNPGSIIWGVKELLANPLRGNMMRVLARQRAGHQPSLETVAAELRLVYGRALTQQEGGESR
jgi:glycosyltransferase involved in cell wall biosynthesis